MADYQKALSHVLQYEGGYSNHPSDRGGETYCGIARNFWPQWSGWKLIDGMGKHHPPTIFSNELAPLVREFYRDNFWYWIKGQLIDSQAIATYTLDSAVLIGATTAIRYLQRACNSLQHGHIDCDGKVGPLTLRAINNCDSISLLAEFRSLRRVHHEKVAFNKPEQEVFLKGWINRANAEVKA